MVSDDLATDAIRTFSEDEELIRKRRELIAERALPLFIQSGFNRTSVREIARACKISIGSLYHYIESARPKVYCCLEEKGANSDGRESCKKGMGKGPRFRF